MRRPCLRAAAQRLGSTRKPLRGYLAAVAACAGLLAAALPSLVSACSSLRMDNGGTMLFGANFDYPDVDEGLVFVNPRGLRKHGLDPGGAGTRARWRSRFASISFNLAGYHYAWAGINERGLVLSTMSLPPTQVAPPDERPPLDSGTWMQLVLDTCATIEEAVATDEWVRVVTVDHFLIADATGNVATIEFLDGEMVVHSGDELPMPVLTNSTYEQSLQTWYARRSHGDYTGLSSSLRRFCIAADRVEDHVLVDDQAAVAEVFDTLHQVRGERFSQAATQWSIVFDMTNLRAYFRTRRSPEIRWLDLARFEPGCGGPVQMLDVQTPLAGDASSRLFDFDLELCVEHFGRFLSDWGYVVSDQAVREIVSGFAGFPCQSDRHRRPSGRVQPLAQGAR